MQVDNANSPRDFLFFIMYYNSVYISGNDKGEIVKYRQRVNDCKRGWMKGENK